MTTTDIAFQVLVAERDAALQEVARLKAALGKAKEVSMWAAYNLKRLQQPTMYDQCHELYCNIVAALASTPQAADAKS